ncbi:MAG: hypothetical protein HY788_20585 [Deltaproteobacteria bacterium]|nr:hypothetical protein [Deltaproteobacteria bacterium]
MPSWLRPETTSPRLTQGFVTVPDRDNYPKEPGSVGARPSFFELKRVMREPYWKDRDSKV